MQNFIFGVFNPPLGRMGGGTAMTRCSTLWYFSTNWYAKVEVQAFWGDRFISGINQGQFVPALINTNEVTFKLGFQW